MSMMTTNRAALPIKMRRQMIINADRSHYLEEAGGIDTDAN